MLQSELKPGVLVKPDNIIEHWFHDLDGGKVFVPKDSILLLLNRKEIIYANPDLKQQLPPLIEYSFLFLNKIITFYHYNSDDRYFIKHLTGFTKND